MPKRIKHGRRPTDVNQSAHRLVEMSTSDAPPIELAPETPMTVPEYMASIGRKGGKIGGKRRMDTMSARKRKQIAKAAAKARWAAKQTD